MQWLSIIAHDCSRLFTIVNDWSRLSMIAHDCQWLSTIANDLFGGNLLFPPWYKCSFKVIFVNQSFCHCINETLTIIYQSIDNFMTYKTMLNYMGKYTLLKSFPLKHCMSRENPHILTLCLSHICFSPTILVYLFPNWKNLSRTTYWVL